MRNLSAADVLAAWEEAFGLSVSRQALTLLVAAFPELSVEQIAQWSVGRRDAGLLALRESLFGPQLDGVAVCPVCGRRVELSFRVSDIQVQPDENGSSQIPDQPLRLTMDDYQIEFRLLNSLDLIAIENGSDLGEARRRLMDRCIESATYAPAGGSGGEAVKDIAQLPEGVADAIAQKLALADPQADIRLALDCFDCGHRWVTGFDIASYFTGEVRTWARRLLREVHDLARVYGWSEADILAMTPTRRQAYLELLENGS